MSLERIFQKPHPFPELSEKRSEVGLRLLLGSTVQFALHTAFHVVLSGIQFFSPNTKQKLQDLGNDVLRILTFP